MGILVKTGSNIVHYPQHKLHDIIKIMENFIDKRIAFHKSINELLDSFRVAIAASTWLQFSVTDAKRNLKSFPYLIHLTCSVTDKVIKIDKTILDLIEIEGFNKKTPLYTKTLINFYRIFTIAIKDIIWKEPEFRNLLNKPELQFLYHLRNASAHNNLFFWGSGKKRKIPKSIFWRNKEIKKGIENNQLYMEFMKPGDLFILLSDISNLVPSLLNSHRSTR